MSRMEPSGTWRPTEVASPPPRAVRRAVTNWTTAVAGVARSPSSIVAAGSSAGPLSARWGEARPRSAKRKAPMMQATTRDWETHPAGNSRRWEEAHTALHQGQRSRTAPLPSLGHWRRRWAGAPCLARRQRVVVKPLGKSPHRPGLQEHKLLWRATQRCPHRANAGWPPAPHPSPQSPRGAAAPGHLGSRWRL